MRHRCPSSAGLHLAWLLALTGPAQVLADGGVVRLRENTGPLVVTVFTDPADLRAGPADVSVLLQSSESGEVFLDAAVELFLVPPPGAAVRGAEKYCGPDGAALRSAIPTAFQVTRKHSGNALLYASTLDLPASGDWQMRIQIRRGETTTNLHTWLPVGARRASFATFWTHLLLPLPLVGLFALHQQLKNRATRQPKVDGMPPSGDSQLVT